MNLKTNRRPQEDEQGSGRRVSLLGVTGMTLAISFWLMVFVFIYYDLTLLDVLVHVGQFFNQVASHFAQNNQAQTTIQLMQYI